MRRRDFSQNKKSASSPSSAGPTSLASLRRATLSTASGSDNRALEWDGSIDSIRNFSIIAHVDHGKSTLSDAILQLTGNIQKDQLNTQTLDTLDVEKERGITVKAMTASMLYYHRKSARTYLLNLIDTPGHVDFSHEVSRSLAASDGSVLLVDATKGVQAQTLANFYLGLENEVEFVGVVSKIDLPHAEPDSIKGEMDHAFGMEPETILSCSGKSGVGVSEVLDAVVESVPPPKGSEEEEMCAFVCDSWFDSQRGVILLVKVINGVLKSGSRIVGYHTKKAFQISELGILTPNRSPSDYLSTGQVGYVIANIRAPRDVKLGDTMFYLTGKSQSSKKVGVSSVSETAIAGALEGKEPIPGFTEARPMVYAGIFADQTQNFDQLRDAVDKLVLNDSSVTVAPDSSAALGVGFRIGFLGVLHMEVFTQRLEQDFQARVIITSPTVPYQVTTRDGETSLVSSAADFPEPADILEVSEPMVQTTIITPNDYLGGVMELCRNSRGESLDSTSIGSQSRIMIRHRVPLQQIVATSFYNKLKAVTSGFASFDYEDAGYQPAPLTKMEVRVNGEPVDALSVIVHRSYSQTQARALLLKLKKLIDRQNFEIVLQAAIGSKIVARERIAPYRKDVLTKSGKTVGGGDMSRKRKLLEKQKAGKKRMKTVGRVALSQEVFTAVMSQD